MKLLSGISRIYKKTKYIKHWVVIPNRAVGDLQWKSGDELKYNIVGDTLCVKKKE
jgi:hypothetical protein